MQANHPVVLVTGASYGIGKAIAEYLATRSYTVFGTSRNPKENTVNGVQLLALDLTKEGTISTLINTIIEKSGQIDFLINNAGMGITGAVEETPLDAMKLAFETNYFGTLGLINEVLPHMRNQHSGMIINITSIAGYMGLPFRGIYTATKGALGLTTEAYRLELVPFNIKMTTIAPGDVATNIAAGRFHTPVCDHSPYNKQYAKSLAMMDTQVDTGISTLKMAQAVHRVMKKKNPKAHYRVGHTVQKLGVTLKRILPSRFYEYLLKRHYKL